MCSSLQQWAVTNCVHKLSLLNLEGAGGCKSVLDYSDVGVLNQVCFIFFYKSASNQRHLKGEYAA